MSLTSRQHLPGFAKTNPLVLSSVDRSRPAIALISEHGDPAAELGKEAAGGQNVYVRQVGEALAALGYQVDMFTRKANPDDPEIVQHSPCCRTIRLVAGPQSYVARDEMMRHMPEFLDALLCFQTKHSMTYKVVHTHYWMSGWVGMQLREHHPVKLIHTYHSLGAVKYLSVPEIPEVASKRLAIEKDILEKYDCVVATSPQEQDDLRQLVSEEGKTQVIPCGTDVENFQIMPKLVSRDKLNIDPQDKVILYVGRFDQRKGIETLVRAVGQIYAECDDTSLDLDRLRLVIVGGSDPNQSDGQERLRIEELVAELGITEQTDFVGMVGHDLLPLYYSAADVCVVPSHYEPFGLVAIEAMACGTPVVASAVGGLNFTVVDGETGTLVTAQDVGGFAEAIKRTLSDHRWAQEARENSAKRVLTCFSWSGVALQLSNLYKELLEDTIVLPPIPLKAKVAKVS
jgi:D-inositol-3-phosphate glycosyltransferase